MLKNISNKDCLSLDNICYLLSYAEPTQDDRGNDTASEPIESLCFCAENSAYSSEFFQAGQQGIKAQKVLVIDSEGYSGQEKVKYSEVCYSIYRVYHRHDGLAELYLTQKIGGE